MAGLQELKYSRILLPYLVSQERAFNSPRFLAQSLLAILNDNILCYTRDRIMNS